MQGHGSDIMIEVQGISKRFSKKNRLKENFREIITGLLMAKDTSEQFKALDNISFSVKRGEVLGIMGANGSGKSTLLKIISRITAPDSGKIVLNGSVSSILEIGTGFHPDLTGRDNVFLTGALLGIDKKILNDKFEKIVAFSELENFIDTPVKYYSSGMFVRLAFSIISELQSDIILLDEVMAVGDTSFSLKSFDKIRALSESGKTIVMVSHDPAIITQLCEKCIILKKGKVIAMGNTSEVVSNYTEEAVQSRQEHLISENNGNLALAGQIKSLYLKSIEVLQEGVVKQEYSNAQSIEINFTLEKKEEMSFRIALAFNHQISIPVFSATPARAIHPKQLCSDFAAGIYHYKLSLPPSYFNQGIFTIDLYLTDDNNKLIEKIIQLVHFKVVRTLDNENVNDTFNFLGGYSGPLVPVLEWRAQKDIF